MTVSQGAAARTAELAAEAVSLYRGLSDARGLSRALSDLAVARALEDDVKEARVLLEESVATGRVADDPWSLARATINLGSLMLMCGDATEGAAVTGEALALLRTIGHRGVLTAMALQNLALASLKRGQPEEAMRPLRESLEIARDVRNSEEVVYCLEGLAAAMAAVAPRRAAQILGGSETVRRSAGIELHPDEAAIHERSVAVVRGRLGETMVEAAWAEGAVLTLEEVIAYALREADF